MKLERLFEVKDNKLFKISGEEVALSSLIVKTINWTSVENGPEEYNEEFLAKLRDELKGLESLNKFSFIEPVFDKDGDIPSFVAAMKHCARRIKDCISVVGFAIPEEAVAEKDLFIEELSQKHQQYSYFCKKNISKDVVLY